MISESIKIRVMPTIQNRGFRAGSRSLRSVKMPPVRIPDPNAPRI